MLFCAVKGDGACAPAMFDDVNTKYFYDSSNEWTKTVSHIEPAQMMPPKTSSPTTSSSVATTLPPASILFSIAFS